MNRDLLRENRIHGDKMFPVGIYTMNRLSRQWHLDYHWHDELEFLYVVSGGAEFQIDSRNYRISGGEAFFINSGLLHGGYLQEGEGCDFCAIVFSPELLLGSNYDGFQEKYVDPVIKGRYSMPVHIRGAADWEREVLFHIREAIETGEAKKFTYELVIKAHLYLAFSLILSNSKLNVSEKKHPASSLKIEKMKEVIKYIQDNHYKKLTIRELSSVLNMSESYFCRFFRQMTRKTPVDYINYYRINRAARLLGDTSKKMIEVAMDVGFDNCSYFISIFKSYMKCTPSEYRRIQCRDSTPE